MRKVESSIEKQSEELAASPLVDGVVENKGGGDWIILEILQI